MTCRFSHIVQFHQQISMPFEMKFKILLRKYSKRWWRSTLKVIFSVFRVRSIDLLASKIFPACEHIKVLEFIDNDFSFFVDIGANRGQFLLIANLIRPGKSFYVFEPLPNEVNKSLKYLERLSVPFKYFNFGLGNVGSKLLKFNTSAKSDCSSFLKPSQSALEKSSGKLLKTIEVTEVTIKDLDLVLPGNEGIDPKSYGFMKIDTQGTELDVIMGGKNFIRKNIKYIYVEVSEILHYTDQATASEVHEFLEALNFKHIRLFNVYKSPDGVLAYSDSLYKNENLN